MFPAEVAKQYDEAKRLYALGKSAQALTILDAIEHSAPNHPEIMHARALCLYASGNLRDAIKLCNQLYTMHRDRRGLELRNRWTNPRWIADTAIAGESHTAAASTAHSAPPVEPVAPEPAPLPSLEASFLRHAALVCIGLDARPRPNLAETDGEVPPRLRASGCTANDYNAANAHHYEVCLPNAAKLVSQARVSGVPVVFIQFGFVCPDATDLSPYVFQRLTEDYGKDPGNWPGRLGSDESRPADELAPGAADRILHMTGDDAFTSTNLRFVLRNLAATHVILVGGPIETSLGRSAITAKQRGFKLILPGDAISAARESLRAPALEGATPDYALSTAHLISFMEEFIAG